MRWPIAMAAPFLALVAACNTAPVLPPDDERAIELLETELWSNGELRAVVRHSDSQEDLLEVTLGATELTVTRIDDTTFSAALPVHTGILPVRIERDGLLALETNVTLHGYLSGMIGPMVGGPVVRINAPGPPIVLGAIYGGAVEVPLSTGVATRAWPETVHSLECGPGIVPGPMPGTVLTRACQKPAEVRPFGAGGLGDVVMTGPGMSAIGISAIVGPNAYVSGRHDNAADHYRCLEPWVWSGCGWVDMGGISHNVRGWVAGYKAQRMLPLGIHSGLYDLATGDLVTVLPHQIFGIAYYMSAVFSQDESLLYVAASSGLYQSSQGMILVVESATGDVREEIVLPEGGNPVGMALDEDRGRILLAMHSGGARALWLLVLDLESHDVLARLPAPAGDIEETVWHGDHGQLFLSGDEAYLVSTMYRAGWVVGPFRGMAIARWNLP